MSFSTDSAWQKSNAALRRHRETAFFCPVGAGRKKKTFYEEYITYGPGMVEKAPRGRGGVS